MKTTIASNNFTAGEVSPYMLGRFDVQKYANGFKRGLNYRVKVQGGVVRRGGTTFVKECQSSDSTVRIHYFKYSVTQSNLVEFGSSYIRVHLDDGSTVSLVSPYTGNQVHELSMDQSGDVLFICHTSHKPRRLARNSPTNWTLSVYETEDGPYSVRPASQEGTDLTLSSLSDTLTLTANSAIFSSGDVGKFVEYLDEGMWRLAEITGFVSATQVAARYVSNAMEDVSTESYVSGDNSLGSSLGKITPVAYLSYSSPNVNSTASEVFSRYDIGKYVRAKDGSDYKWFPISTVGSNGSSAGVGSSVTQVTYSYPTVSVKPSNRVISATLTASASLFQPTDVDRHVRLSYSGAITWGKISAYTSPYSVSVVMKSTVPVDPHDPTKIPNYGVASDWKLGAFSDTTGWPRAVSLHSGQRLVFAGTPSEPSSVWLSEIDDYVSFATTKLNSEVLDTSGMALTIFSGGGNSIVWLYMGQTLLIGTTSSVWQLRPANSISEALTPTNFNLSRQTRVASAPNVMPASVGSAVLFSQLGGLRLQSLAYDFNIDSYAATDLSAVSDHLLAEAGGLVHLDFQDVPDPVVWCVAADGSFYSLTYDKQQDVFAWAKHSLGGSAKVESVAIKPATNADGSRVYFSVCRENSGGCVRTIELMSLDNTSQVDSSVTLSTWPLSSDLSRMNGTTVSVLVDGVYKGEFAVASGAISLEEPDSFETVEIGYLYPSYVQLLPPETMTNTGPTVGRVRDVYKLAIRVLDTTSITHWTPSGAEIVRTMSSYSARTGVFSLPHEKSREEELGVDASIAKVGQTLPYPSTLLCVAQHVSFGEVP